MPRKQTKQEEEITNETNNLTQEVRALHNTWHKPIEETFDNEDQKKIANSVNKILDRDTYNASEDSDDINMDELQTNIRIIDNIMSDPEPELESFLNKYYNTIFYVALYAKKIAYQYHYKSPEKFRNINQKAENILSRLEKLPEEQEQLQKQLQPEEQPKKRGLLSRLFGKKGGKSKRRKTKKKKTKTKTKKTKK